MKKIVLKSALITLLCVAVLFALVYAALAIFSPVTLARFYGSTGAYSMSVKYYEKQYSKTNSTDDLYALCVKVDDFNDSARAEKYLTLFIDGDSAAFRSYCAGKDGSSAGITTREFCFGKLTCATYTEKGCADAVDCAKVLVGTDYTKYNPFNTLIHSGISFSAGELSLIKAQIEAIAENLTPEQQAFATRDVQYIDSLLS